MTAMHTVNTRGRIKYIPTLIRDNNVGGGSKLTVLDVEEGDEHGEQAGHGHLTHQLPVAVVGAERQRTFAQVSQTLWRHTVNTQTRGFLAV